jgi:hypothetical protein
VIRVFCACAIGLGVAATACQPAPSATILAGPTALSAGGDLGGGCSVGAPHLVSSRAWLGDYARATGPVEARSPSGATLRAWVVEKPRLVWQVSGSAPHDTLASPGDAEGTGRPFVAVLDGRGFLVVWSEESSKGGFDLHALAVGSDGLALGPAVNVSTGRGSVVGQAGAKLGPGPGGSIDFVESTDDGFGEFSAPVHCSP